MNFFRTTLLLAAMTALFMGVGFMLGGATGMMIALGVAVAMNLFAYWNSDKMVLRMHRAREVDARTAPEYYGIVRELADRAGLPMPRVFILEEDQPNAFATGRNPENAAVAATRGLLSAMSREEVAGVMAHELAHVQNRDTLIMTITATIAGAISMLANFAFFFGGNRNNPLGIVGVLATMIVAPLAAMLVQTAISRTREYAADRRGGEICGNPLWLANALSRLEQGRRVPNQEAEASPATAHMFIVNPLSGARMDNLFSTHPNTQNRIAELRAFAEEMSGGAPASLAGGGERAPRGPWGGGAAKQPRGGGAAKQRRGPWDGGAAKQRRGPALRMAAQRNSAARAAPGDECLAPDLAAIVMRQSTPHRTGPQRAGSRFRIELPDGAASRVAAAAIVSRVMEDHQPLAAVLDDLARGDVTTEQVAAGPFALGNAASLDARDAGLARAIARVTIRRRGDVDWCLAALMDKPLPRKAAAARTALRVGAAQILFMRAAEHAAVNAAVAILKADAATAGFSGLANAVLRRLARERSVLLARLPVEANTPGWLWQRWQATYGFETAAAIAAAHREEPGLDIAVARPGALPDGATALPTGGGRLPSGAVAEIEGYAEGAFWVQDMAAQLPAILMGDVADRRVLDMCAAPGGKAMQLAARGAHVTAVEVDADRAERLKDNLARTRLSDRVEVVVDDARNCAGAYDAVLLDAPCTATGTLRRQPDAAWNKGPKDVTHLANLQRDLLRSAASVTAPGGVLVFATCSLEPEEGEDHRDFVVRALPSLALDPIDDGPAAPFATTEGTLRTMPHMAIPGTELTGLDGFFAARFRRL